MTADLPLSLQQHLRLFVHFFTAVLKTDMAVNVMQVQQQTNGSDVQWHVQHLYAMEMSHQTSAGMRKRCASNSVL